MVSPVTSLDAYRRQRRARAIAARLRLPAVIAARLEAMWHDLAVFRRELLRDLETSDADDLREIIRQNDALAPDDPGHDNPPAAA